MTLSTAPVEDEDAEFVDDWAPGPLDRIGQQFLDVVNLLECQRVLDERSRRGSICM